MSISKSVLLKPNDLVTDSLLLEESYIMSGVKAILYLAESNIPEIGYKNEFELSKDPIHIHILPDDAPKPKLLKQLGWNIETEENQPLLATIPRYISTIEENPDARTGMILPIEYYELKINPYSVIDIEWSYDRPVRKFQITSVASNMINPTFYYLKLVPYRERIEVDPAPNNDSNLNYLQKDEQFKFLNIPRESSNSSTDINY